MWASTKLRQLLLLGDVFPTHAAFRFFGPSSLPYLALLRALHYFSLLLHYFSLFSSITSPYFSLFSLLLSLSPSFFLLKILFSSFSIYPSYHVYPSYPFFLPFLSHFLSHFWSHGFLKPFLLYLSSPFLSSPFFKAMPMCRDRNKSLQPSSGARHLLRSTCCKISEMQWILKCGILKTS